MRHQQELSATIMARLEAVQLERLAAEYEHSLELASKLMEQAQASLIAALDRSGIALAVPLQSRIKSLDSAADKIARSGGRYSTLADLQDLVGLRVVALFRRDIDTVADCVERSFRVIRRCDAEYRLDEDQFGYSSLHYVVAAPYEWRDGNLLMLEAEVQIRTLAQHLWAAASHVLQYKSPIEAPVELRRSVNRAAALLELVDVELDRLLEERELYRRRLERVESESPLDTDSLRGVLESLWPHEHRLAVEPYDHLVRECRKANIATSGALASIIAKHRSAVLRHAAREAGKLLRAIDQDGVTDGSMTITLPNKVIHSQGITPELIERLRHGFYYGHVALTRVAMRLESGGPITGAEMMF